jgi:hypothetical protein
MKVSLLALLGLFVVVDAIALLRAEDSEERTWRLTVEQNEPRLEHGTDNPEDTPIAFYCEAGRGRVEVWINETSNGVKPRRSMTASLTAGRTISKVRGKTMPNEEAGTPSFLGTLSANDPLFAALSKERVLVFVVGPSRDQVPLRDVGDKAGRLSRLCQKR